MKINKKWLLLWIFAPYLAVAIVSYRYLKIENNFVRAICSCMIGLTLLSLTYFVTKLDENKVDENQVDNSKVIENKVIENKVIEIKEKKEEKEKEIIKLSVDEAMPVFEKYYKGVAKIEYRKDENCINITPEDKNFMNALVCAQAGEKEYFDSWNRIKEDLRQISGKLEDKELSINIINNVNKDNIILIIQDGCVVYDCLQENYTE